MYSRILLLFFLFSLVTITSADTPESIAADYRTKATQALKPINEKLEAATVAITAALVKAGDTSGAELVTDQLKDKIAGELVLKPHSSVALLWSQYDAARIKALEPVQKAAIARIEAVLRSNDGKKLETVSELGKVRAEIEAGKTSAAPTIGIDWTLHKTTKAAPDGRVQLNPDGSALFTSNVGNKTTGKWEFTKNGNSITVVWTNDEWKVAFKKSFAEVRSIVWSDTRYLIPAPPSK